MDPIRGSRADSSLPKPKSTVSLASEPAPVFQPHPIPPPQDLSTRHSEYATCVAVKELGISYDQNPNYRRTMEVARHLNSIIPRTSMCLLISLEV